KSVAEGAFHPEKMAARYRELHDLIQPYVTGNDGELEGYSYLEYKEEFTDALQFLIRHAAERYDQAIVFGQNN
ncbi:MAG: hypothetical protein GY765_39395, partial [bacterium]|nr:hypothetical protein [bacterium]